jgi:hypothetical protein
VHSWSVGDHLTHRSNPELGTGRITAIDGRVVVVEFPNALTRDVLDAPAVASR